MRKIKRTIYGIRNMPRSASLILARFLLIACGMIAGAIILTLIADVGTYLPFSLIRNAQALSRLAPGILMGGVFYSVLTAAKDMK